MSTHGESQFDRKTIITYFDPFDVFRHIQNELEKRLPLHNLHWSAPGRPVRSIPTLEIDLVEETAKSETAPKHQMLGLSTAPYLKMMFVKCEDSDTYRSTVRKMIREWLSTKVTSVRDPTEWLIVHYVPSGSRKSSASGTRFKLGVFDKIKADFNSGSKRDRVLHVRDMVGPGTGKDSFEADLWKECMIKIKEGVLEAFSKRVSLYEEEVGKLEAKKNILGWNFGTFFVMKEGLALSFEYISLFDDALLLYDELEEAFGQITHLKTATHFSKVGFDDEKPAPKSLLNLERNSELRHAIMSNSITLFDFHCYLFCRQAYLLLYISSQADSESLAAIKLSELFLRLRTFLNEMNNLLVSNKKGSCKISEWIFNVSQEVLKATSNINVGSSSSVSEGRGEMFLLSRKSLETLAAAKDWHIEGVLSEVTLHIEVSDASNDVYSIQNPDLISYLQDENSFHKEYRNLTKQAIACFDGADRVRTVFRLSSQLALLDYQIKDFTAAASHLEKIPRLYGRHGWDLISVSLMAVYVRCLVQLDRSQQVLFNSLDLLSQHKYLSPVDKKECIQHVLKLSGLFSSEIDLSHVFKASVDPNMTSLKEKDCYYLELHVQNSLGQEIPVDRVSATLKSISDEVFQPLEFNCIEDGVVITPGLSKIKLYSTRFVKGQFVVVKITMSIGKLVLSQTIPSSGQRIIELFPSPNNLWAYLGTPHVLNFVERRIALYVNVCSNNIESCIVRIEPSRSDVKLRPQKAQAELMSDGSLDEDRPRHVSCIVEGTPPQIHLEAVSPESIIIVSIPFVVDYDVVQIGIKASITYTTSKGTFIYQLSQDVSVPLTISVNVQDFFRGSRLFSRFSILCNDPTEPVRIMSTGLGSSVNYATRSPSGCQDPVIIYGSSAATYIFTIEHTDMYESHQTQETLPLTIRHRLVRNECVWTLWEKVQSGFRGHDLQKYLLLVQPLVRNLKIDVLSYALTGRLEVSSEAIDGMADSKVLLYIPNHDRVEVISKIREILTGKNLLDKAAFGALTEHKFDGITHELIIPVSIPHVHVVHTIEIDLPKQDHFVVGEPISIIAKITSTTNWGSEKDEISKKDVENAKFLYEIVYAADIWAVSGKQRSIVPTSSFSGSFSVPITLVPLRTGQFSLPKIDIKHVAKEKDGELSMEIDDRNSHRSILVMPEFDRLTISF